MGKKIWHSLTKNSVRMSYMTCFSLRKSANKNCYQYWSSGHYELSFVNRFLIGSCSNVTNVYSGDWASLRHLVHCTYIYISFTSYADLNFRRRRSILNIVTKITLLLSTYRPAPCFYGLLSKKHQKCKKKKKRKKIIKKQIGKIKTEKFREKFGFSKPEKKKGA